MGVEAATSTINELSIPTVWWVGQIIIVITALFSGYFTSRLTEKSQGKRFIIDKKINAYADLLGVIDRTLLSIGNHRSDIIDQVRTHTVDKKNPIYFCTAANYAKNIARIKRIYTMIELLERKGRSIDINLILNQYGENFGSCVVHAKDIDENLRCHEILWNDFNELRHAIIEEAKNEIRFIPNKKIMQQNRTLYTRLGVAAQKHLALNSKTSTMLAHAKCE